MCGIGDGRCAEKETRRVATIHPELLSLAATLARPWTSPPVSRGTTASRGVGGPVAVSVGGSWLA